MAALLVLCAGCTDGEPVADRSPATTDRARDAPGRASQSPDEAKRDGVAAEVAALSYRDRVVATSRVRIDDETWLVSRPSGPGQAQIGCDEEGRGHPGIGRVCGAEYGELLKVDGKRIVRAYPFPSVPPQHIAITEDAVFCGRHGDGELADAMLCRVDLGTLEPTVRVFPSETDSAWAATDGELPDGWTVDDEQLEIRKLVADDGGVWAQSFEGGWTKLDPDTLEIVERGIERVTTDP